MNIIIDDIISALDEAKAAIQSRMEEARINATGNTSRSFRVELYDGGVRLVMGGTAERTAPLPSLEVGRPPGAVPKGFADILYEWSKAKGIPFESESRRRSFSYLLGRRIAREGTIRHGRHVDIYSSIVVEAARSIPVGIAKSITAFIHSEFTDKQNK